MSIGATLVVPAEPIPLAQLRAWHFEQYVFCKNRHLAWEDATLQARSKAHRWPMLESPYLHRMNFHASAVVTLDKVLDEAQK